MLNTFPCGGHSCLGFLPRFTSPSLIQVHFQKCRVVPCTGAVMDGPILQEMHHLIL